MTPPHSGPRDMTERRSADEWARAWQPMVDAVGTDFGADTAWRGADAIDPSALRRFLEPLEFDCPLHHDEAFARRHGHPTVIAPFASLLTFTIPPLWSPGEPTLYPDHAYSAQPDRTPLRNPPTGIEPPTAGYFATDIELDLFDSPHLGQRLVRTGNRLVSCIPKSTSVGNGAFTTWESRIVAEPDVELARLRIGRYSYQPHTDRPAGDSDRTAARPPEPAASRSGADEPSAKPERGGGGTARRVDWERVRAVASLAVGDELPAVELTLPLYRLVVAAGGNRDFNSIHHNSHYARATGAADAYANTTFILGSWERAAREFLGATARFESLRGFRMGRFNLVGSTMITTGRVVELDSEGGRVVLELWCTNDGDVTVGPGRIAATLPLAEAG